MIFGLNEHFLIEPLMGFFINDAQVAAIP